MNAFSLFRSYLPFENGGAPHLNKFESPLPKDALCQTLLKLTQWFCRERFLIFVNVLLLFGNYLSLENGGTLHLNNLESSSPKDALCQWFLRRFFIFVNVFSLLRNYLLLEKSVNVHLIKLKPPSPRMLCAKFKLAKLFWRGRKCEKFTTTTTMTSNGQFFFSEKLTWAEGRNIFFVFFLITSRPSIGQTRIDGVILVAAISSAVPLWRSITVELTLFMKNRWSWGDLVCYPNPQIYITTNY